MSYRLVTRTLLIFATCSVLLAHRPAQVTAQGVDPCGVVDAIDYPIDGVSIENDDFGMYRAVFDGRHSGIDIAFGRLGDPVRAAARGRITYSDPAGWDTEKGVVIIEHVFPDNHIYFTLYGHVIETDSIKLLKVGTCVEKGQIIAAVGKPSRGAPHLHYEIRTMEASTGGPGYWPVDPLIAGWLHPIDFTEQWKLRLTPAFRSVLVTDGAPTAPPLWQPDGSITFAQEYHLEQRSADNSTTLWRLDVQGLIGIINLPDGRILGYTNENQVIIVDKVNGRFAGSWNPDRPLLSPPLLLGNSIVFLSENNQAVSYDVDGKLLWQTEPLGTHIERYIQQDDLLAVSTGGDGNFKLWVIDGSGKVRYSATTAAPIIPVAVKNGFLVMVASQVAFLDINMAVKPLMDVGQALGRNSQIASDAQGNVVIYPGYGQRLYSYAANGQMRWQTELLTSQLQAPLIGSGSGCLVYILTGDGTLLVYRAADGALRGSTSLYAGGSQGHPASRFLKVSPDDQVQFSAGFLSIATVDGPTLANDCKLAQ